MIDFNDPKLVAMHGDSWVDVQVAFYDFIWKSATAISAGDFNEKVLDEARQRIADEGFSDESSFYNEHVAVIKRTFKTADEAWDAFLTLHRR